MITPKFIELAYINQIKYREDEGMYHLEVNVLLDFQGEEVVTKFSVNKGQLTKMGLPIEPTTEVRVYYEDMTSLGTTTLNQIK